MSELHDKNPEEIVRRIDGLISDLGEIRKQIAGQVGGGASTDQPKNNEPPFYGLGADCGLHRLAKSWKQVTYQRAQCEKLLEKDVLKNAIESTLKLSPARSREQGFRLLEGGTRVDRDEMDSDCERYLEALIAEHWAFGNSCPDNADVCPWKVIVQRQVPLFDNLFRDGWDKIDLLGLSGKCEPVVIELKKKDNYEPPLRALLEAAAYAVALRKAWPILRDELFTRVCNEPGWECVSRRLQETTPLEGVPIAIVAPPEYWARWRKGEFLKAVDTFIRLTEAFEQHKFPVSLLEIQPDKRFTVSKVEWKQ